MARRGRGYDCKFKAEMAISALNDTKSIVELCAEHNVPKTNVLEWRDKLIAEAGELFVPTHDKEKQVRLLKQEIESLHKVVGEVTVENSFLKKKLER
jgi:transposase